MEESKEGPAQTLGIECKRTDTHASITRIRITSTPALLSAFRTFAQLQHMSILLGFTMNTEQALTTSQNALLRSQWYRCLGEYGQVQLPILRLDTQGYKRTLQQKVSIRASAGIHLPRISLLSCYRWQQCDEQTRSGHAQVGQ